MAKLSPTTYTTTKGSRVTLRSPNLGEGEALLIAVKEVIRRSAHLLTQIEEFTYTVEQENEMIQKYLEHPDKIIIVPEVEGKIAGMLDFSTGSRKRNSHTGEFGISLLPEFQGQGIGKSMVNALIQWAKANPRVETLRLRVHAKNVGAIGLYKKLGFREEGREIRGAKIGPKAYDDVLLMALSVDSV